MCLFARLFISVILIVTFPLCALATERIFFDAFDWCPKMLWELEEGLNPCFNQKPESECANLWIDEISKFELRTEYPFAELKNDQRQISVTNIAPIEIEFLARINLAIQLYSDIDYSTKELENGQTVEQLKFTLNPDIFNEIKFGKKILCKKSDDVIKFIGVIPKPN